MKRPIFTSIFLLGAVLHAQAYTDVWDDIRKPQRRNADMDAAIQADASACDGEVGVQTGFPTAKYRKCMLRRDWKFSHIRETSKPRSTTITIYNRDSPDPNVGWHWEDGMRTCHQDCDNPEIPGSGFTCKDIQAFGRVMRECDK